MNANVRVHVYYCLPSGLSAWRAPCPAWSSSGPPADAAVASGAPSAAHPAASSGVPSPDWTGAAAAAAMTATGRAASPDFASAGRSTAEQAKFYTGRGTLCMLILVISEESRGLSQVKESLGCLHWEGGNQFGLNKSYYVKIIVIFLKPQTIKLVTFRKINCSK